jgi:hypothetical protein
VKVRAAIRRLPTTARNVVRDLRYGAFLGGTVRTRHAEAGAFDAGNADYDDLTRLFANIAVTPDDVIVDVGSGKGRAINWFLSNHPGRRIYGIELDAEICAKAAKRLRRHENVTILCGDATTLLPADGTLFYLFNPFDEAVMGRFIAALLALGADRRRRVVYHNCKFLDLFLESPSFDVQRIDLPTFRSALIHVKRSDRP